MATAPSPWRRASSDGPRGAGNTVDPKEAVSWTRTGRGFTGVFAGGRARSALALAALLTLGAGDIAWAQTSAPSTTAPAAPGAAAAPAAAAGSQHRPPVGQRRRRLDLRLLLPRHQAGDRGPHPPALRRAHLQARRERRRPHVPVPHRRDLEQPAHRALPAPTAPPPPTPRSGTSSTATSSSRPSSSRTDRVGHLHRLSQPEQRLQLRPGNRLRLRLQRRQAPRPLRR